MAIITNKITKTNLILEHLKSGKTLTPKDAYFLYKTMRLGAIIFNLRNAGYNIITHDRVNGSGDEYAEYELVTRPQLELQG